MVPGTHKLPQGPGAVFGNVFRTAYPERSTAEVAPALIRQEAMPNVVKFAYRKGTACAFDTAVYHTALGNASGAQMAVSNQTACLIVLSLGFGKQSARIFSVLCLMIRSQRSMRTGCCTSDIQHD